MKSLPKILIIFFLTMFILQMICLFFLLAAPVASQALEFKPQVGIPGAEKGFGPGESYTFVKDDATAPIAKYVRAIYNYGIGIIGILAAVVLMIGGVMWIIAGGNATQIGEAKSWIGAALTGLILALTSYLILNTINPALVNLQTTPVPGVTKAPDITKLDKAAAKSLMDKLQETYGNKIVFASNISLDGIRMDAAAGIEEIKKMCDAFYSQNACKITIVGGIGGDPSGKSFTIADFPTEPGGILQKNLTIGELVFDDTYKVPSITRINATKACLTSAAGVTYKITRSSVGIRGIEVTVDPACSGGASESW